MAKGAGKTPAQAAAEAAASALQGMLTSSAGSAGKASSSSGATTMQAAQVSLSSLPPPNLDAPAAEMSLAVLRRIDSSISQVRAKASHVSLYDFNVETKSWSKRNIEGALFVVVRNNGARTAFQIIVLNRQSPENLVLDITPSLEMETKPPYLLYKTTTGVNGLWFFDAENELPTIASVINSIQMAIAAVAAPPMLPMPPMPTMPPQPQMLPQPITPPSHMQMHMPQQPQQPQQPPTSHVTNLFAKLGVAANAAPPPMPPMPMSAGMPPMPAGMMPMQPPPHPAPAPTTQPRLTKEIVRTALQRLVQDDRFVSLVAAELEAALLEAQ
ncbi:mRNA-decapping enzyme [Pycnococcus provasolii]